MERVQQENILCGSKSFRGRFVEAKLRKMPKIEVRSAPGKDAEGLAEGFRGRVSRKGVLRYKDF